MIIVISRDGVSLDDADNCNAFHLEARGVDRAAVGAALAAVDVGRVDGDDAYVEPAAVEQMAAAAGVGADWSDRYRAMLGYAASKGWLDDAGAIQAHIESR